MDAPGPDILCFFSKSRDVPPGKGAGGERVHDPSAYITLRGFPDWRKTLSNFDVAPFAFRGMRYNTIEHAFQAAKIAMIDPEKASHFSLDSGHDIGRGDGGVAQKHRKYALLSNSDVIRWSIESERVMAEAAAAKYSEPANAHARAVLAATGDAQLLHISRGKPPHRFRHLEEIRQFLFQGGDKPPP